MPILPINHADAARNMRALPKRKHPAHGVLISRDTPTIVFVTVCTLKRLPWLADSVVQENLVRIWQQADAWRIGFYILMPDHMHLFCAPYKTEFTLKTWISHWKRKFSCLKLAQAGKWQMDYWDTRLRCGDNYHDKWEYVRQNPVRKGLIQDADQWPYQGVLHELRW